MGLAAWEEDASLMLMPMLFIWHLIGHMVTFEIIIIVILIIIITIIIDIIIINAHHMAPCLTYGEL